MDYNSIITTEIPKILENIIQGVDRFSEYYKLEDLVIKVEDTDVEDIGTYVTNGTTCEFLITVNYRVTGEEEWKDFYISIPRMIGGIFVINGKYKMLSRYLGEDYTCRRICNSINLSWNFSYNLETQMFYVIDSENKETYQYTFAELKKNQPEKLELTEHQGDKLQVMLDLDTAPEELTEDLIKLFPNIVDNPRDVIHKRINSIETILTKGLRNQRWDIIKELTHNFYNQGSLSSVPFQKVINSIFNNTDEDSLNSTIGSTNVNPLSFDSTNQKIIIPNEYYELLDPGNYDSSMGEIIDPIVTPDNANINRLNYLTNSVSVVDGYINIKCYDTKFNLITVNYVKYQGSKVLLSSEVESYEDKLILPGEHKVRKNRKEFMSTTWDYIECQPDDRLSVLSRMIPMLNQVDSVRGAMAAKMITQAVPLCLPEEPLIQSGHEGDNALSTTDIKYESASEGKVIEVTDTHVVVDVDGIPREFKVPKPAVGIYDITAVFTPKVKVGDTVHKGMSLITHDIAKGRTKNLGINALVCIRPWRGYNYEDGIIISQSCARKLSHFSILDVDFMITNRDKVKYIAPIGKKIKSRDLLVESEQPIKSSSVKAISESLTGDNPLIKHNDLLVPNNTEDAYITDIVLDYDKDLVNENSPEMAKYFKTFLKNPGKSPKDIPGAYNAKLPKISSEDYEGYVGMIRIRILVYKPATVGSKLANLYGSKGLVSLVIPDDEMDRTEDGRVIDIILNSDAVIARKNFAQIPVLDLARIAERLKVMCATMDVASARALLDKYKMTNYSKLSDEGLIDAIKSSEPFRYITGSISKISSVQVLQWMKELGIEEMTYIIDGKSKRKVRNPVYVGNMYMIKLYQLPEHYSKVHTSSSEDDPILGQGLRRDEEGQSLGALETYALLASDLEDIVLDSRKSHRFADAENVLLNFRLAGINVRKPREDE